MSACSPAEAPRVQAAIVVPVLPDAARKPCTKPAGVPDRDLTESEVLRAWSTDRVNLKACEQRRAAAVAAVDAIEAAAPPAPATDTTRSAQ